MLCDTTDTYVWLISPIHLRVTDRLGGALFGTCPIWENYDPHNKIGQKHHFWTQRMPPSSNLKVLVRNSTIFIFCFFTLFSIKCNDMFEMTENVVCFVCLFIWDLYCNYFRVIKLLFYNCISTRLYTDLHFVQCTLYSRNWCYPGQNYKSCKLLLSKI